MNVLIADDDRVFSHALLKQLKGRGVDSTVAYDAVQTVILATRTVPDAILLDVGLPGGSGMEVLKRLKDSGRTCCIPVIVVSASPDPNLAVTVKNLGADGFVQKPIHFESLFAMLGRVTQPQGSTGETRHNLEEPAPAPRPGAARARVAEERPSAPVLVVEDEAVTRRVIRSILEKNGYAVEMAASAEEALEKVKGLTPSLLICDVQLPGASGFDLCRRIKQDERLKDVPVVFLTAQCSPQDYKAGEESGGTLFVAKPVRESGLLMVTRVLLPAKSPAPSSR